MSRAGLLSTAGGLFGVLVGMMIGLSNTPVVGAFLGALLPIVVLIASGFSTARPTGEILLPLDSALLFVSWFAGAASVAVVGGMLYRNSESPSMQAVYLQYRSIGFTEADARQRAGDWFTSSSDNGPAARGLVASVTNATDACEQFPRPEERPFTTATLQRMRESSDTKVRAVADAISEIPATMDEALRVSLSGKIYDLGCAD